MRDKDPLRTVQHTILPSQGRKLIRKAKDDYYRNKIQQNGNDPSTAWRAVNAFFTGQSRSGTLDPNLVGSSVNHINSYFASLGESTCQSLGRPDPTLNLPCRRPVFSTEFRPPSLEKVAESLESMDARKAEGLDGIPSAVLKNEHQVLASPICDLMTAIISTSTYPDNLNCPLIPSSQGRITAFTGQLPLYISSIRHQQGRGGASGGPAV